MLNKLQVGQIIERLIQSQYVEAVVAGESVIFRFSPDFGKIVLSTPVFRGENYIPKSVRRGLKSKAIFKHSKIQTNFSIDEKKFQVLLNFTHNITDGFSDFQELLNDFLWIADEWRHILEKYGREDLLFVYVNKN